MEKIKKLLDIRFEKHKQKWDTLIAITGNVGVGKSNLYLNMLDHWLMLKYGYVEPEFIKYVALTKRDFLDILSSCDKNDMVGFDEAGKISSRKSMSTFNTDLTIAYQIIRADTIFTVLILPDIKYLDSFFRHSRVKHLFYVYRRGMVKVWLTKKLKLLLAYNMNKPVFNYDAVTPDFRDTFPVYKGALSYAYDKLKQEKTTETRRKLKRIVIDGDEVEND